MPISIENKKGSFHKGSDKDGQEWKVHMYAHYGYITGTISRDDGEDIDVYINGPDDALLARKASHVCIVKQRKVEQVKQWSRKNHPKCLDHAHDSACPEYFDEDKVILGYNSKQDAIAAYLKQYESSIFWGSVSTMRVENFRKLVPTGKGTPTAIPYQHTPISRIWTLSASILRKPSNKLTLHLNC